MSENLSNTRHYSISQMKIISDLCQTHGLDPLQISFEGDDLNPIFDYEAVSLLSLKLTDIAAIDTSHIVRDHETGRSTCRCRVDLPDGRDRTVSDSAAIGDIMHDSTAIETVRQADAVARARASRLGIRSVGINLFQAHQRFMETGQVAASHLRHDPRAAQLTELHALAAEIGLIKGSDRSNYESFVAESFDGATSSKDLNDLDFQRLISQLRAMARHARTLRKVPA